MKEKPEYGYELRLQEYSTGKPGNPAPVPPLLDFSAGQESSGQSTATAPQYRH